MAKKEKKAKDPAKQALIREMIAMYKPETMADVQSILLDMFSSTIEEMLHAELDSELGYPKHDQGPKETTNRRNGSYPKTVHGELGDMGISVPRDREGEYEPVAVPKGTSDVSELERKVLKGKGAFPNKQAAMKILYLRTMDIMKKWANPISNWGDHTRQTGSAVGRRLGRLTAPGSSFSSLRYASFVKIGT